jgi:hypothetical protein
MKNQAGAGYLRPPASFLSSEHLWATPLAAAFRLLYGL